ncbi:MAG: class I SAM-dependent methyltransferase [Methanolinea sp.]
MHRIVNWNELWKAIFASSPGRIEKEKDPGAVWDRKARAYQKATRGEQESAERDLAYVRLLPTDTVLDMGAGTGRLAVPMARRVSHVTALDASSGMLSILRENMGRAGLANYTCVHMRWEDVVVGRDIAPHDVVVAAFSLGIYDLAAALEKLDAAARRAVYLFWHAGEWRGPDEMELYRAVFGELGAARKGYPDYIFPLNILHDAGIYASVRIYDAGWETTYASVDEAAESWIALHCPGLKDSTPVREYFARRLRREREGGPLAYRVTRRTAVVWWEKPQETRDRKDTD